MKEQILKLRSEGKTYKQIKILIGCSIGTIAYHCGVGQKQKSLERTLKNRKKPNNRLNHILNKKYYNIFVRDAVKGNKRYREKSNFTLEDVKNHILSKKKCYITGKEIDFQDINSWQIDHVIPLSKGGTTSLDNIRPVIKLANFSKSSMLIEEYITLCKDVLTNFGYKVEVAGIEPAP